MPSFVLLAFGFASPLLLWGLLLAGVPLLIQWLHRRKYTERVWAAMRFLRAATESQTRRLRRESLLLLCVRTLILLLAAVALAEPLLESSGWLPETDTATHTLILLDTSLSMRAVVDGVPIGERAKDAARTIVRSANPGDSFQLVTMTAHPEAVIRQPSFSVDDVLAEIDRLEMTESFGDVSGAVVRAKTVLAEAPSAARSRLAVISDFQQSNWQLEEPAARERTRQALTRIAKQAAVSLVPVGSADPGNAAVQDARVESSQVAAGTTVEIIVQVRNFGPQAKRQQRLQLLDAGRVLQTRRIDLPPYGEVTASFVTRWNEPGIYALQVRLEDDALPTDNDRWLTVQVKDELSVLLVNGRASERSLEGATDYVELALRPTLTAEPDATARMQSSWGIQPTVIGEAELVRTDLSVYDCVFMCDVPFFGDEEIAHLETFVRGGGGLVISLGDQVQLDEYSRQLGADATGLLPVQFVRVVGVVGGDDADAAPFHFAEPVAGHPLTQSFAGNPRSGFTTANIYRYVEVRRPQDSAARTAISFANGAPAIVENTFGSGRAVLVTTSLDDRWGSWALWPSFLPMMHELVEYAIRAEASAPTLVGQPLHVPIPRQGALGQTVALRRPDGRSSTLHPSEEGPAAEVTLDDTSQSGIYQLSFGPPTNETKLLAVNIDVRESDLKSLADDGLQSSVLGSIPFELSGAVSGSPASSVSKATGAKLTGWLLLGVLTLLLVEQVMAWNGRYGLVALVASPAVVAGLALMPLVSSAMFAAVLAGIAGWCWRHRGEHS